MRPQVFQVRLTRPVVRYATQPLRSGHLLCNLQAAQGRKRDKIYFYKPAFDSFSHKTVSFCSPPLNLHSFSGHGMFPAPRSARVLSALQPLQRIPWKGYWFSAQTSIYCTQGCSFTRRGQSCARKAEALPHRRRDSPLHVLLSSFKNLLEGTELIRAVGQFFIADWTANFLFLLFLRSR